MAQGSGLRGFFAPGGGAMSLELIEDTLGSGAFTSPNASLNIAYDDAGDQWTFDINEAHTNTFSVKQYVPVVVGGPASGNSLTLEPNDSGAAAAAQIVVNLADDPGHVVQVNLNDSTRGATQSIFNVGVGQSLTYTITGALLGYRAMVVAPTIQIGSTGGAAVNPNGVLGLVFNHAPTILLNNVAASNINAIRVFHNNPTFTLAVGSNINYVGVGATDDATLFDKPQWTAQTGTEQARIAEHSTVWMQPTIGLGWTIDILRGVYQKIPAGAGKVTDWAVIEILDIASGALVLTNPAKSLRSTGPAVEMQHMGPAVFGATVVAGAASSVSVGVEVQSTTRALLISRMTGAQANALTAVDGMMVYVTDNVALPGPNFYKRLAGAWVIY